MAKLEEEGVSVVAVPLGVRVGVPPGVRSGDDEGEALAPALRDARAMGLNALFIDCTFAGVTRVESYQNNSHVSWQFYGVQESDLSLKYPPPMPAPVPSTTTSVSFCVSKAESASLCAWLLPSAANPPSFARTPSSVRFVSVASRASEKPSIFSLRRPSAVEGKPWATRAASTSSNSSMRSSLP